MPGIAYVNGRYVPLAEASVNIEDRGYQFGDGIYEVVYCHNNRLVDADLHMARLIRSAAAINLPLSLSPAALTIIIREVLARNRITTGLAYLQLTRGTARRDHAFPAPGTRPSLVITARHRPAPPASAAAWACAAITLPDERWARCDIKSVNLLPNVLARQAAKSAGAYEAIFYDAAGNVTEGAASSVWIVDTAGALRTRHLDAQILPGCTRASLLNHLPVNFSVIEGPFTVEALRNAREIFLTSATSFVKPVTRLDAALVCDGTPGPITTALLARYLEHMETA